MSILLSGLMFVVMLQAQINIDPSTLPNLNPTSQTDTSQSSSDAGQPASSTPIQNRSSAPVATIPAASDADLEHAARVTTPAAMDQGPTSIGTGTHELVQQSLKLPDYLLTRDKSVILDNPEVKSLNQSLRYLGMGVWIVSLTLILLKHLAGPFVGADIMDLSIAFPVAMVMGTLGWFNYDLLSIIMDVVGKFLVGISAATLSSAITPGLSFNTGTQLIIGPILGVAYDILSLWLIFKLWLQIAWLMILSAGAPIYISATGAPFLGTYGSHWWRNWFGTLIDPILTIVGLHLVAPWFDLFKGAPDLATEMVKILTMFVIISTIGWHQGAYKPQGVDAMIATRLWMIARQRTGHQPQPAAATPNAQLPPPTPVRTAAMPTNYAVPGVRSGSSGGGSAARWKNSRWAVGGTSAA